MTLLVEADGPSAERLARTLSAMVPAVVSGVLQDAFVVNRDESANVDRIADAAGTESLAASELNRAFVEARADWLLCMEPGARLSGDWVDVVSDILAEMGGRATTPMRFREKPAGFSIRQLFSRPRALRYGLIIHKTQARAARADSLEALARGRATRPIAARIVPADI